MDGRLIEYMKEFVKYFIQYDKTCRCKIGTVMYSYEL